MLGDVMVRPRLEWGLERGLSKLDVVRNMCLGSLRFTNQIREAGCGSLRDDGQRQESSLDSFDEQRSITRLMPVLMVEL